MPLVTWDTQAEWDAWYDNYGRTMGHFQREFDLWLATFGPSGTNEITATDRIIIVGSGPGYGIEPFHAAGYPNCWGFESSPYAVSERDADAALAANVVLVEESILAGAGRIKSLMRAATGDDVFNWIITEDILTSLNDTPEIGGVLSFLGGALDTGVPLNHIMHFVMDDVRGEGLTIDPAFNVKTFAQWVAMRTNHSWASVCTWEILVGS